MRNSISEFDMTVSPPSSPLLFSTPHCPLSTSSSSFLLLPPPLIPPGQLWEVGISDSKKKTAQDLTLVQSKQHFDSSTATIGCHGNTTRADCQPVVGAGPPTRGGPWDYGSDWSGEAETTIGTGTHCIRSKLYIVLYGLIDRLTDRWIGRMIDW